MSQPRTDAPEAASPPPGENLNDNKVLDALTLNRAQYTQGIVKCLIFTVLAVFVFFVPISFAGESDVTFGVIYKTIVRVLGIPGHWLICSVVVLNGLAACYAKFFCRNKDSRIYQYYEGDSKVHALFYLVGLIFSVCYLGSTVAPGVFSGPAFEWMLGESTGGSIIPSVVQQVAWIIPVGSFFMPFLTNYGIIDFIGSLMEPLMRPVFKVPGRSAVNAIASFVSSSSVGVLITSKLYRAGIYTKKECALIATGFSAVSVGFAYMVIQTAGLEQHFIPVYFLALLVTMLISIVMCRIPPLSRKPNVYLDGRVQTTESLKAEAAAARAEGGLFRHGIDRAIKKAYTAPPLGKELAASLKDGYSVMPKVISLLTAVGTLAMIIATYTPVFDWLGYVFQPLLRLVGISGQEASIIAPSLPVGIAEMFLPVLLIQEKVAILSEAARYMVVTVSMVQIIFFSETIVVMMATKIPVSLKELVICFFERTIIAIPITAIFMHLLF